MIGNEPEKESSEKPKSPPEGKVTVFATIGRTIIAPLTFLQRLVGRKRKIDEVVVYSAHPAFFLWIVIAVGFGLGLLVPRVMNERVAAWVFISTLVYFILALVYDLSLKKLLLCTLVVSVFWLFAKYMETLHHVVILGWIMKHFAALDPKYDRGTVSVICWLLLLPW